MKSIHILHNLTFQSKCLMENNNNILFTKFYYIEQTKRNPSIHSDGSIEKLHLRHIKADNFLIRVKSTLIFTEFINGTQH